jgi:hypothetical protein
VTAASIGRGLGYLVGVLRLPSTLRALMGLLGVALIVSAVWRWSPAGAQCLAGVVLLGLAAGRPLLMKLNRRAP